MKGYRQREHGVAVWISDSAKADGKQGAAEDRAKALIQGCHVVASPLRREEYRDILRRITEVQFTQLVWQRNPRSGPR